MTPKIGLVGGLSWHSTIEYYRTLNLLFNERHGGNHSVPLLLESLDQEVFENALKEDPSDSQTCAMIVDSAKRLERSGAALLALCANGIHRFIPQVEKAISIPVVHIVDATASEIKRQAIHTVGLLGIKKTMSSKFYPERLAAKQIKTIVPTDSEQDTINALIYSELCLGKFTDAARRTFLAVIERLIANGSQGIILGCTEIPLLLKPEQVPVPSFDTTTLHCKAILEAYEEIGKSH